MQNTLYSLPSCHVVKKQDVRVGQFHTLSHNTMYPFEWFWRNGHCISQNRSGERMHRLPSQNVMYGSESYRFDIGVARSSGEILVLSVRYVKMGSGVMVYPFEWFWRNAECISQNRSGERMHRLPSQNVTYGSESDRFDIGVARSSGEILVLSVRYVKGSGVMVYPFQWFWRNEECISQNRSGDRMHRLPSQNVTYGSESDQFDIGVARSSSEILVLSVRYVKMGPGVMELSITST